LQRNGQGELRNIQRIRCRGKVTKARKHNDVNAINALDKIYFYS
jgi:hypothetical protein